MKKQKLYLLFIYFLYIYGLTGQSSASYKVSFQVPEFKINSPKWVYTVFDSTNIGHIIERHEDFKTDGYNMISSYRPLTWSPLIKGNYFYTTAMNKGTTSHIFGSVVQKISLETGIPVWTSVFDNRNTEKQEYVQQLSLDEFGTLKILTQRRIKDRFNDFVPQSYNIGGDSSTLCIREYNSNNGELLTKRCHNPSDTSLFYVSPHSEMRRILFRNADGSYQFIENQAKFKKSVFLAHLDENEKLLDIYIDTFYYDKSKYNLDTISIYTAIYSLYKPNEDTLVSIHVYASKGINIPDLSYLTIYDKELNKIKLISLKDLYSFYNDYVAFNIKNAWSDRVLIKLSRLEGYNTSTFYLDYTGKVLAHFDTEEFENEYPFYTTYLPKSDKYLLLTRNKNSNNKNYREEYKMNFYLFENGKWEFKHNINYANYHYVSSIYSVNELDNNDILMCVDSRYFDKNKYLISPATETWMRIDGHKIGLVNSTEENRNINNIKIFPNPAKSYLNIEFPSLFFGYIEVLDIFGRLVKKVEIKNTLIENINISNLKFGIYYIKFYNKEGNSTYKTVNFITN